MKRTDYIARIIRYFRYHPLWLRLLAWIAIGLAIYFAYGRSRATDRLGA